jgi:hypothetical protein
VLLVIISAADHHRCCWSPSVLLIIISAADHHQCC